MREIKFRAKMVDDSRWVFGGGVWTFKAGTALFGEDENKNPVVHAINPETVGQFTGLLDSNGKEIYEGDIIQEPFWALQPVIWKSGGFSLGNNHLNDDLLQGLLLKFKVVGNIYDNPELIKKEKGI